VIHVPWTLNIIGPAEFVERFCLYPYLWKAYVNLDTRIHWPRLVKILEKNQNIGGKV